MQKTGNLFYEPVNEVLIIDISDRVSLINIDLSSGMKVTALSTIPFADDKIKEINPGELNNFIQQNKIQHKNAIITLPLDVFLIKRIMLPALSDKELFEAIKWQLKPEAHFDLARSVISYEVLQKTVASDGVATLDCICIAAPKEKVIKQIEYLHKGGFSCLSIVPQAIGYAKIINRLLLTDKDTFTGLLYADDQSCYFCINKQGKLEFYRELPFSINKLRESFKISLYSDKEKIELSYDEIEEILFKVGITEQEILFRDKISSAQLVSLARPVFERLAGEIKRSLLYFSTQFADKRTVAEIFVGGKAQRIPNFDTFLSKNISLPVKKISLAGKLDKASAIPEGAVSELAGSIGAAIDYTQGINLLPRQFRIEKRIKLHRKLLQYTGLFCFLLIMLFYLFAKIGTGLYEKRLSYTNFQLEMVSDIQRTKEKVGDLGDFIREARGSGSRLATILKALSINAPKELFLNRLSFNTDTKIMDISGFINNKDMQAETVLRNFIRDMRAISLLVDANISSVEKAKLGEQDILKFGVTFKIR